MDYIDFNKHKYMGCKDKSNTLHPSMLTFQWYLLKSIEASFIKNVRYQIFPGQADMFLANSFKKIGDFAFHFCLWITNEVDKLKMCVCLCRTEESSSNFQFSEDMLSENAPTLRVFSISYGSCGSCLK